jgi:hypothetical protein
MVSSHTLKKLSGAGLDTSLRAWGTKHVEKGLTCMGADITQIPQKCHKSFQRAGRILPGVP